MTDSFPCLGMPIIRSGQTGASAAAPVHSIGQKAVSNGRGRGFADVLSFFRTNADAALEEAADGASSGSGSRGPRRRDHRRAVGRRPCAGAWTVRTTSGEPVPRPVGGDGQRYMPGLDGLRAIAVLAVIAFHLNTPWASGGLLGVGMFFTLS